MHMGGVQSIHAHNLGMQAEDFVFRKASLLDLPFIFNLIIEGSVLGSFSENNLSGKGTVRLFLIVLANIVPFIQSFLKSDRFAMQIFEKRSVELGFIATSHVHQGHVVTIELCSIKPEYRNQKYGTTMLKLLIVTIPEDSQIVAYTKKYSRAMQHILKKSGFFRVKQFVGNHMECYILKK